VACDTSEEGQVDGVPAAGGVENAAGKGVGADALAVHALRVDQLVVLEDHISYL